MKQLCCQLFLPWKLHTLNGLHTVRLKNCCCFFFEGGNLVVICIYIYIYFILMNTCIYLYCSIYIYINISMVHFHHHDDTCVWGACNIVTSSTRPWMWDVWWRRWLTSHSRRRSTLIGRKRVIDLLVRWWQGWGRCEFSWCFARCLRTWPSLLAGALGPWFWLRVGSRQCVHP